jgi:hypothetical protein
MSGVIMTNLSDPIRAAINSALHNAERDGCVFDVYTAAVAICETFPDEQIPIDSLVDAMIAHLGSIQAVEISPPESSVEMQLLGDAVSAKAP